MLLTAQSRAVHTTYGAVEFATAFFRWAYRYPHPTRVQSDEISAAVVSSSASAGFKNIAAGFAKAGNITGGTIPDGEPFYLSTASGAWRAGAGSTADRVIVELSAAYVTDGAVSATKGAAISATVVWTDGKWRLLSQQAPDTAALTSGGTQFSAGC